MECSNAVYQYAVLLEISKQIILRPKIDFIVDKVNLTIFIILNISEL